MIFIIITIITTSQPVIADIRTCSLPLERPGRIAGTRCRLVHQYRVGNLNIRAGFALRLQGRTHAASLPVPELPRHRVVFAVLLVLTPSALVEVQENRANGEGEDCSLFVCLSFSRRAAGGKGRKVRRKSKITALFRRYNSGRDERRTS